MIRPRIPEDVRLAAVRLLEQVVRQEHKTIPMQVTVLLTKGDMKRLKELLRKVE
ncbi:hypothetical protein LCGC14_2503340 [marine sediment metagenome]|uniref:Uncharacterized protein n=1 Tax=marine sediment metagenome TaxID=412755 RepID=A0A0F9B174_9ZZZZ